MHRKTPGAKICIIQQLSGNLLSFAIAVFCDADYVVLCCLRSLQNLIDSQSKTLGAEFFKSC